MSKTPSILAIDQGTTGTTCLVVAHDGRILGRAYAEFTQYFPQPGWVEHDAAEIWDVTKRVAREALSSTVEADVRGLGITNQRETIVLWDRETLEPVHRAIVWQDRRTSELCSQLKEKGHEPEVRRRTGLVLDPYFSGTKLSWLFRERPELRARAEAGDFDLQHWGHTGMNNLTPLWLLKYLPNMLACHVTIIHECRGPSNTITCCEASSGLSIGESMRVIQRGAADACLSGGVESKVNPLSMLRQGFASRLAPTTDDQDPASVVRPFDRDAGGTVIGEGGGIIVVEAAEVALGRGAEAYAEITGFGSTQSYCADTIGVEPEPDGTGIADAMELALQRAGAQPGDIDAIAPLGSGIPAVDRAEAAAIKRVFGSRAADVPLITTVPNTGNCNAGAGAVSVAVAVQALRTQTLPARINTVSSDGLDAAARPSCSAALGRILVTQTSQGGQNVAMVLQKVDVA